MAAPQPRIHRAPCPHCKAKQAQHEAIASDPSHKPGTKYHCRACGRQMAASFALAPGMPFSRWGFTLAQLREQHEREATT